MENTKLFTIKIPLILSERGKERSKALLLRAGSPPSLRNRLPKGAALYSFYLTGIRIFLNLNNLQRVQSTAFNSADSIQPACCAPHLRLCLPAGPPAARSLSTPPSTFPVSYVPCVSVYSHEWQRSNAKILPVRVSL